MYQFHKLWIFSSHIVYHLQTSILHVGLCFLLFFQYKIERPQITLNLGAGVHGAYNNSGLAQDTDVSSIWEIIQRKTFINYHKKHCRNIVVATSLYMDTFGLSVATTHSCVHTSIAAHRSTFRADTERMDIVLTCVKCHVTSGNAHSFRSPHISRPALLDSVRHF